MFYLINRHTDADGTLVTGETDEDEEQDEDEAVDPGEDEVDEEEDEADAWKKPACIAYAPCLTALAGMEPITKCRTLKCGKPVVIGTKCRSTAIILIWVRFE